MPVVVREVLAGAPGNSPRGALQEAVKLAMPQCCTCLETKRKADQPVCQANGYTTEVPSVQVRISAPN